MSIKLALVFLVGLSQASALEESKVKADIIDKMENGHFCANGEVFWKRKVAVTKLDVHKVNDNQTYRVRYSKYGCSLGKKGSLVISPGRSESSPEYYETAIDYINLGYSPVYVIDHRGQGLSPRRLKNTNKGHLEHFNNYVNDLAQITRNIEKDLASLGRDPKKDNLYYTSNSMGGAIGIRYLQLLGNKSPYKAAAVLGSMIKINYLSFIKKEPTLINRNIYSEAGVIAQASIACNVQGKCKDFTRPKVFGDYVVGNRNYVQLDNPVDMESYMTHSKERYDLKTYIWDKFDWSKIAEEEYQGENWTSPQLGGATYGWTLNSTKALIKMRSVRAIKKLGATPIFILTGEKDLRGYTPSLDGTTTLKNHIEFCKKINTFNGAKNKKLCTFAELKGGYHEIYKESDRFRNPSIKAVVNFFEQNSK